LWLNIFFLDFDAWRDSFLSSIIEGKPERRVSYLLVAARGGFWSFLFWIASTSLYILLTWAQIDDGLNIDRLFCSFLYSIILSLKASGFLRLRLRSAQLPPPSLMLSSIFSSGNFYFSGLFYSSTLFAFSRSCDFPEREWDLSILCLLAQTLPSIQFMSFC